MRISKTLCNVKTRVAISCRPLERQTVFFKGIRKNAFSGATWLSCIYNVRRHF